MFASRTLFITLFLFLASSLPTLSAPADGDGARVQARESIRAVGFNGLDPNFAGARRQSCPDGFGVCPDDGCCPIDGECCGFGACCNQGFYCVINDAGSEIGCCPDGELCRDF